MRRLAALLLGLLAGSAATAQTAPGDPAKGAREFGKCKACHAITDPSGAATVKGGRLGPDLFGVIGREVAAQEGFTYGDGILALRAKLPGAVWDAEAIAAYVTDPTGYLDSITGDPSLRSKMTFKMNRGQADVAAFLLQHSPTAPQQVADGNPAPVSAAAP